MKINMLSFVCSHDILCLCHGRHTIPHDYLYDLYGPLFFLRMAHSNSCFCHIIREDKQNSLKFHGKSNKFEIIHTERWHKKTAQLQL